MEDITSKMVDYVVLKIEDFHLPPKFYNTIIESNDDTTIIRSNLFDIDDINQWVNEFSELTNTQWNTRDSCPQGERFVCWKKFICHHSSFMKVPVTTKRSKSYSCEATVYIKIKLNNSKTRYTDPFIKVGQCAIIVIKNKHSHSLLAGETLSFLPSSKSTREKFIQYFESGLGISESCHYHKSILKAEGYSEMELVNGRINPSQRTVRYWYNRWQVSNPFILNGLESMFKILSEHSNLTFSSREFNATREAVNSRDEELENGTDTPSTVFEQILNPSVEMIESDEIQNDLVSCLKIITPCATHFKEKKRKWQEDYGISRLIYLNAKISEQLEISNSLKSQILKEIRTENYLKLKKIKFTCMIKKIGLSCVYSL